MDMTKNKLPMMIAGGILLIVLPFVLQSFGNAWVRIADTALLYVLLVMLVEVGGQWLQRHRLQVRGGLS